MTVPSVVNRISYAGAGIVGPFAVPFFFLESDDLLVLKEEISSGAITTLALTVDYTVAGAAVPAGGSVTLVVALSALYRLHIIRDPDKLQSVDYTPNDPFPAETHERAVDKLTMLVQRVYDYLARCLKAPDTVSVDQVMSGGNWLTRASRLLGFDSAGVMTTYPVTTTVYGVRRFTEVVAAAGKTVFATGFSYVLGVNALSVYVNGLRIVNGVDYNESLTGFTMLYGLNIGDRVDAFAGQETTAGAMDAIAVGFTQKVKGAGSVPLGRTIQKKGEELVTSDDFSAGVGVGNIGVGPNAMPLIATGTYNTVMGSGAFALGDSNSFAVAIGAKALANNRNVAQGGAKNVAIGYQALFTNTGGQQNVAIGINALLQNILGDDSTAIGSAALQNSTADSQTAVGAGAAQTITGANNATRYNVAVGAYAFQFATSGTENVAVGYNAMNGPSTGDFNVVVGSQAMQLNTTGNKNVAAGWGTLALNTTGAQNVAIGYNALGAAQTANDNVAIGRAALLLATAGTNTAIGAAAGNTLTTGTNVTCVGYNAQPSAVGATNEMTLGDTNLVTVRTTASLKIYGNGSAFTGNYTTGSIADNATATITKPSAGAAVTLLIRESEVTGAWALFGCSTDLAAMVKIASGGAGIVWTTAFNTAGDVNVYQGAGGGGTGDIIIQNKTGSNKTFRVAVMAAY